LSPFTFLSTKREPGAQLEYQGFLDRERITKAFSSGRVMLAAIPVRCFSLLMVRAHKVKK